MANILYEVNGKGAGHSTRSREVFAHSKRQDPFEQICNAYWLGHTGYGTFWEVPTRERVESFFFNIPQFREKLAHYPPVFQPGVIHKTRFTDCFQSPAGGMEGTGRCVSFRQSGNAPVAF